MLEGRVGRWRVLDRRHGEHLWPQASLLLVSVAGNDIHSVTLLLLEIFMIVKLTQTCPGEMKPSNWVLEMAPQEFCVNCSQAE